MRRSVQPNCPRAMTCCFFASLKILAMSAERLTALPPRQRLERLLPMAGFQVSIYGRFWVSTEGLRGWEPVMRVLEDREEIRDAARRLALLLSRDRPLRRWLGYQGDSEERDIYWHEDL